jgi:YtcA family
MTTKASAAGGRRTAMAIGAAGTFAGCDPVINIAGANFPGWLVCAIAGIIIAALLRPLLARLKLEPYLGPLVIVYPSLAVAAACVIFLIFFNRI